MSEPTQDDAPPELEIPDKKHFKIGEVASILDVKPYILRYWESEFSSISPRKTSGRHRMYTRDDIELLATIKSLLYDQMFTIAGARKRLEELAQEQGGPMAALFAEEPGVGMGSALEGAEQLGASQELEQLRVANNSLRGQLEEAESNLEATSMALHDVQMAHNEALNHVGILEQELSRVEGEATEPLREENERLSERVSSLEAELDLLVAERDALREALEAERESVREAREEAARAREASRQVVASAATEAEPDPEALEAGWLNDLEAARRVEGELRNEMKDQLIHHRLFLKRLRNELVSLDEFIG